MSGLDLLPGAGGGPAVGPAFLAGAAAGLVLCLARRTWSLARLAVTAVHELGHAVTAILLGGRVGRVHLWANTAGLTTFTLPAGLGRLRGGAVALAGYPAPGLAGLAGAWLVVAGLTRWWVGLAAAVAGLLLALWVRNAWGVGSTLAVAALLGWLAWAGPSAVVTGVGSGLAVLLLAGGWRAAWTHLRGREGRRDLSDAVMAGRLLLAPAPLWSGLFVCAATATLLAGGWLLVRAVTGA
ncbi:MAG TPA: M50 family metallopeptidase [Actinomycetes bacterium]|nr:M50 family metallopeptidase [Actinomycetes bacterium]